MKTLRLGDWLEVSAQYVPAEWMVGVFLWIESRHVTLAFGFGPFDVSVELWQPVEELA